ncbi:hypothetical protein AMTRI_Chr12g270320 [Amborella trichopoda]
MPLRQPIKKLTRYLWDLSFQPSVMMVTHVLCQQTLNSYQNMLIIFFTVSINTLADGNFFFFYDIMACGDQVQRVRGSLLAHLWVHVVE